MQVAVKFVIKSERSVRWPEHSRYGRVTRDVIYMDLVSHANIIALFDVFSDDKYLYIVSQQLRASLPYRGTYVSSEQVQELHGTLSHPTDAYGRPYFPNGSRCLSSYILANGPMPLQHAKYVFYQLVDAVAHLHEKGITHCDIKPENILIDSTSLKVSVKLFEYTTFPNTYMTE